MYRGVQTLKITPCRIWRGVKVGGPNGLMMGGRMMLGEVVGTIRLTFAPIDFKLPLSNAIADPIKMHINCF